jgi:hypothetical protein
MARALPLAASIRDIAPNLKPALVALAGTDGGVGSDVLRDHAAPLGAFEDRPEALQDLAGPGPAVSLHKIVAQLLAAGLGEPRELGLGVDQGH